MMNKKAVGPFGALLLFGLFIVFWGIAGAPLIAQEGAKAAAALGNQGPEAFFYANLNFVIFIFMIIGLAVWSYFGANQ